MQLSAKHYMTDGIAIIGSGMIGQSWAICFARAGFSVTLFDHVPGAAMAGQSAIGDTLGAPAAKHLLQGQTPGDVLARIHCAGSLADAVRGAVHVQENTPEQLDIKCRIFAELDAVAPQDAVIASSTSALLPSAFTAGLAGAQRCLVAHPLNPPHLIPAVELVPSPDTSPETLARTTSLMRSIGQQPLTVIREVAGFIMNRLQGAVLDEALWLVAQGYASVADIDTAMRDGLARRWSFMGPFETIDLNAPGGVQDFFNRYGPAYAEIGAHRPNRPAWTADLAARIDAVRRTALPITDLPARQNWRNARLAALATHFQDQPKD
jgi:L-gulonate 3-dehydrogenase